MKHLLIPALLVAAPVHAQFAPTAEERLRALVAPPPVDIYREEKNADLLVIEERAETLFGTDRDVAIALFTGPDCEACATAEAELRAVTKRTGLRMQVFDTSTPDAQTLFGDLGFDTLPAYVMPDRLIRGHMPDFVLQDYLTQ